MSAETAAGMRAIGAMIGAVEVKIDWVGLTKRARQIVGSGEMIGDLTAAPRGSVVAFVAAAIPSGDGEGIPTVARYTVNLADGSAPSRVPSAAVSATTEPGRRPGRGGGGGFRGGEMVFTRDGRSLYFRSGRGIYVAPVGGGRMAEAAPEASAFAGRRGRPPWRRSRGRNVLRLLRRR